MSAGRIGNHPAFSLECRSPVSSPPKAHSSTTIMANMTDMTRSPPVTAAEESATNGATTNVRICLSAADHSRVIEMAWEDRTPFEAIECLYGLPEAAVIRLMRRSLKPKAFKNWRQRVAGRVTKHGARRDPSVSRGFCATQYKQRSK